MPLGLDQLTPDQLLELTIEVSQEWAQRDPYLRNMAQASITTEAQRLAVKREAMREAAAALVGAYVEFVRAEGLAEMRQLLSTGQARILTPAQEARIAVESTLEAKIKIIDETVAVLQEGKLQPPTTVQRSPQPPQLDPGIPPDNYNDYEKWAEARDATRRGIFSGQPQAQAGNPASGNPANANQAPPPFMPPKWRFHP